MIGLVNAETVSLTVTVDSCEIIKDQAGYDRVIIDGYKSMGAPGNPMLPSKVFNVLLPPDVVWDSVELTVVDIETEVLTGTYRVEPAAPDAAYVEGKMVYDWGQNQSVVDGKNTAVYDKDVFFPSENVALLPYSQMRKWKYSRILFVPAQYNPGTGELKLIKNIKLEISFQQSRIRALSELLRDTAMDGLAPELFINYNQGKDWYVSPDAGADINDSSSNIDGSLLLRGTDQPNTAYDYVIITTNAIVSGSSKLANFITHKQARGHSVLVVTETNFGSLSGQSPNHRSEKIRQWLKNNYIAYGIEYVLLIGDPHPYESGEGDIPMKMCWPRRGSGSYEEYEESPTDAFYADLTGNWDLDGDGYYGELSDYEGSGGVDFAMEVWVGRIPVYSAAYSTLDNILQKIMDYENESNISWRKSILLPMSFSTMTYDGAPLAEQMMDDYLTAGSYTSWTQYQQGNGACSLNSSYPSDQELRGGTVVRDRWAAQDYGVVCWWGHGSATSASVGCDGCLDGTLFSYTQTSSLDDNHPSFTYQCSCTNAYPENSNNLAYSILKQGGIGTVSASRVSWFNRFVGYGAFDGSSTNSGIGYEYVKRLTQPLACGRALYEGKLAVVGDVGSGTRLMNQYDFNLYGDPTVGIDSSTLPICCDSGTLDDTCTITTLKDIANGDVISGTGNLVIASGGNLKTNLGESFSINMAGDITIESGGSITGNLSSAAASNFTIESGGSINADANGFASAAGPGAGANGGGYTNGGGGAGYGGDGGNGSTALGGIAYGSFNNPVDLGSGGGIGYDRAGGAGGGVIKLVISGTLNIDGAITSNGGNGNAGDSGASGGGSGGSIWIQADILTGSGAISANGGNGGSYSSAYGGGGGGGRIAIEYSADSSTLAIQTFGGTSGAQYGDAGTIFPYAPTVTTQSVSDIGKTTATGNGNITALGKDNPSQHGVCWSTSQNPTTADSKTEESTKTETGAFTSSMTGLAGGITYYVRAYATNTYGMSYGRELTFTTLATTPTITTTATSSITATGAQSGGNVTSDGGADVTARGVCWSTSADPTIGDRKTSDGTGTGSFTSSIKGLIPNITYYVRAYAANAAGTAYGDQVEFKTKVALTMGVSPGSSGTTNPVAGTTTNLDANVPQNITASAATAYHFVNWTAEAAVNATFEDASDPTTTVTLTGSATVTANFALNTYPLTIAANPIGGGTVTKDPDKSDYDHGEEVKVTATANANYIFTGWSGAVTGADNPATISMDSSKNVTANFDFTYTVTYNGNGNTGGTVPIDGNAYQEGDEVTVLGAETLEKTGYNFNNWNTTADGNGAAYALGAAFNMPATNVTFYAQWTESSKRYVCSDGLCGGNTPCHKTVREAVEAAGPSTLILIAAEDQNGSFSLDDDKGLTLQGGWDKIFSDLNGGTTTLQGAPKALQGSLTFQNLRIVP